MYFLSQAHLKDKAFRFDADGISFYELHDMRPSKDQPWVLPLTIFLSSKKKPGIIGKIKEIPGRFARFSPEIDDNRDHWSVWVTPLEISGYAHIARDSKKIGLNPSYTGNYDRYLDR